MLILEQKILWLRPEMILRLCLGGGSYYKLHLKYEDSDYFSGFHTGYIFKRCSIDVEGEDIFPLCLSTYSDATQICRFNRGIHPLSISILNYSNGGEKVLGGFIPEPTLMFCSNSGVPQTISSSAIVEVDLFTVVRE
jgi:hypothetical protein